MFKASVIGASGYTGVELLRILSSHPEITVVKATAAKYAGTPVRELFPSLAEVYRGDFEKLDTDSVVDACDIVFLGLPHGESMKVLPGLSGPGLKIVDLSADFRFEDSDEYERHYGEAHKAPDMLDEVVYGLPEVNRSEVESASLIANPGCYPTAALLGLYPAAKAGLVSSKVVIDAKSGISGAGRKLSLETHYPQIADGMEPYAVGKHRHMPEIRAQLGKLVGDGKPEVVLTPHLAPMNRGILCTMYISIAGGTNPSEIRAIYEEEYLNEQFVTLLPAGTYPSTKSVQGSNNCHVGIEVVGEGTMLVVMTAIDNLVKGASGQAVQNMNLMCGMPEEMGLSGPGLFP